MPGQTFSNGYQFRFLGSLFAGPGSGYEYQHLHAFCLLHNVHWFLLLQWMNLNSVRHSGVNSVKSLGDTMMAIWQLSTNKLSTRSDYSIDLVRQISVMECAMSCSIIWMIEVGHWLCILLRFYANCKNISSWGGQFNIGLSKKLKLTSLELIQNRFRCYKSA